MQFRTRMFILKNIVALLILESQCKGWMFRFSFLSNLFSGGHESVMNLWLSELYQHLPIGLYTILRSFMFRFLLDIQLSCFPILFYKVFWNFKSHRFLQIILSKNISETLKKRKIFGANNLNMNNKIATETTLAIMKF